MFPPLILCLIPVVVRSVKAKDHFHMKLSITLIALTVIYTVLMFGNLFMGITAFGIYIFTAMFYIYNLGRLKERKQ